LPIEFSIQNGKQSGVLSALLHRNRYALEVALEIESSFFEELRVIRVRLRFRRPLVEFREESACRSSSKSAKRIAIASVGISARSLRAQSRSVIPISDIENTAAPKTTIMAASAIQVRFFIASAPAASVSCIAIVPSKGFSTSKSAPEKRSEGAISGC